MPPERGTIISNDAGRQPHTRAAASASIRVRRGLTAATILGCVTLVFAITAPVSCSDEQAGSANSRDLRGWRSPGAKPRSDARATARVVRAPESVPGNSRANRYVPSRAQLASFRGATDETGQTTTTANRLLRYVTGRPRLRKPSTEMLIQWASHKWGIPTDLIRAQMFVESKWRQSHLGDLEQVPPSWYVRYPAFARVTGGQVYQSLGIAQVKWTPNGKVGAGTEPLRWKSTAFNLDYYAATIRYYYDGACHWCTGGYGPGQAWNSVGAWYSPNPWANPDARRYAGRVRQALEDRPWR
jgi:hypothetical protein